MYDRRKALSALRAHAIDPYPARCRRTHLVGALERSGLGSYSNPPDSSPVFVAGRLAAVEAARLALRDSSGVKWFERRETGGPEADPPSGSEADPQSGTRARVMSTEVVWSALSPGDIVELEVAPGADGTWRIAAIKLLAKALRVPATGCGQVERPGGGATLETLRRRARIIGLVRVYFEARGFLEVETPILAMKPGLEPHLDPFETRYRSTPSEHGTPAYLLTSPEYAMKRLLVAGAEKIFQFSKVFRNGEVGPFHNPEFTMLEWYRAYASYLEIQADLEGLMGFLSTELGLGSRLEWGGHEVDLTPPWPRVAVRQAFLETAGIDLALAMDKTSLWKAARAAGITLPDEESWEEGFFRILVERIEPALGFEKPVFLTDYPPPFAALAKERPGDFRVAERFELYVAGVEVGNAYTELNEPDLQRERFEEERSLRQAMGAPAFAPDPDYLEALELGLPPSGGIAVGVDRLVMLLLNEADVRHTLAFPFPMDLR